MTLKLDLRFFGLLCTVWECLPFSFLFSRIINLHEISLEVPSFFPSDSNFSLLPVFLWSSLCRAIFFYINSWRELVTITLRPLGMYTPFYLCVNRENCASYASQSPWNPQQKKSGYIPQRIQIEISCTILQLLLKDLVSCEGLLVLKYCFNKKRFATGLCVPCPIFSSNTLLSFRSMRPVSENNQCQMTIYGWLSAPNFF